MKLKTETIRALRERAHQLKPVVMLGAKGLTESVHAEVEAALTAHELIKIRISGQERDAKKAMITDICEQHQAHLIQSIGHVFVIYRPEE